MLLPNFYKIEDLTFTLLSTFIFLSQFQPEPVHATFKILALIDNCTARLENDWQPGLFKILNDAILHESF